MSSRTGRSTSWQPRRASPVDLGEVVVILGDALVGERANEPELLEIRFACRRGKCPVLDVQTYVRECSGRHFMHAETKQPGQPKEPATTRCGGECM